MRLPDFLIIGAMKSGTTTLYNDLLLNPRIFMPVDKEPHNLTSDAVLTPEGRAAYAALFAPARPDQLCGEASTGYTKRPTFEGVAPRARALLGPSLKLVYVVREPVSRAISHHYHDFSWNAIHGDADRALRESPEFTDYSRYAYQLEPWLDTFGQNNVLVIIFEEYVKDRRGTVERVSRFLGVEPALDAIDAEKVHNKGDRRPVHKGVLTLINQSWVYRRVLRHLIPVWFRHFLYRTVFPKAPDRPAPPTDQTVQQMRATLDPDAARLAELLGRTGPIWPATHAREGA
jgi:hypothetical protein